MGNWGKGAQLCTKSVRGPGAYFQSQSKIFPTFCEAVVTTKVGEDRPRPLSLLLPGLDTKQNGR